MSEEETDDLFAEVKLLLDEIVVAPERPDRAVQAAVLLHLLEVALYGAKQADDADVIEQLENQIEALEVPWAPQ